MSTVADIKAAIEALSPAERAELTRWLAQAAPADDAGTIPVRESALNPEEDSPELEAELLKAVNGPHVPLREAELQEIADKAIREHRAKRTE
jgi:hypothetical protein